MIEILKKIFYIILIIIVLWVVFSYVEIICNNLDKNPQYTTWNFFQLLIENSK